MRILLSSPHRYPADDAIGSGLSPKQFPSGSAFAVHDLIAKGLGELGHTVFYRLDEGASRPLPSGVTLVSRSIPNVDILHTYPFSDADLIRCLESRHKPWVATCHGDIGARGIPRRNAARNWIFVSRTLARLHRRRRYVLNAVDPSQYLYSSTKDDYVLFMSSVERPLEKGLDLALSLAKQKGFNLLVAGTATTRARVEVTAKLCKGAGARYFGDIRGPQKAEVLAGAKALLFPSRLKEGFGLPLAEALMSGTPVICSDQGACPEIISSDVGFVCKQYEDYLRALDQIHHIDPQACRDKALKEFHYLRMAGEYAGEYEKEISRSNRDKLRMAAQVIRAYEQQRSETTESSTQSGLPWG